MTPWVLMVAADEANACSARAALEKAGFAVELVPTIEAALACLAVMSPTALVVDGKL